MPVSIGDMARTLMLNRHNAAAGRDIARLTDELARGTVADPGRHLRGFLSPLAALEATLARNAALGETAGRAATRAAAMQASLARIDGAVTSNAAGLLRAAQSGETNALAIAATAAGGAFEDVIAALNTQVEGRSLFAGAATDGAALVEPAALLAAARAVIAPAATPDEAAALIETWLSDPAGFAAQAYLGTAETSPIPIADGETARLDATAADPALRGTLKGLLLGALMSDPALFPGPQGQSGLARLAGEALLASSADRALLAAGIGLTEERLDAAQSRHAAESLVLQQARADMIAVDGYDTATRLQESQARLDMLYTLTARLSRLGLAEYL